MTSLIDPSKPTTHIAYTADVRNNFQIAYNEITALQGLFGASNQIMQIVTSTANNAVFGWWQQAGALNASSSYGLSYHCIGE